MILLFSCNAEGDGPVRTSVESIVVCRVIAMAFYLVCAIFTVLCYSDGMESVCPAVAAHVAQLAGQLLVLSALCSAAATAIGVAILIPWLD